MSKRLKNSLLAVFFLLVAPLAAKAQDATSSLSANPAIIDEKVQARSIIEQNVKIKNNSPAKLSIYGTIRDLDKEGAVIAMTDPSQLDRSTSVASWTEFSHGVLELMPGEEKEVALKMSVNPLAKPGKYYAAIDFSSGSNRYEAEANSNQLTMARVLINLDVSEVIIERAEIAEFNPLKSVNIQNNAVLGLKIRNIGNRAINPTGRILLYDRNGNEIDEVSLDKQLGEVASNQIGDYRVNWDSAKRFGKFKAKLELEYGNSDKRDLQDTVYFYILPVWFLGLIFGLILFVAIAPFALLRRISRQAQTVQSTDNPRDHVINLKK
ncbi:hypothetical protein HGA64_00555 [Candidatus Falkowbacteria bacterium]|nr:hypothetical protein [Candidatus Falkowbacteria bacterium]